MSWQIYEKITHLRKVSDKDIKAGEYGQVLWSGTIMNAKLVDNTTDIAKIGEIIYVLEVKGNVLICGKQSY